jgi:hypothetical protein
LSIQAQAPTQAKLPSARQRISLLAILIGIAVIMAAFNLVVAGVKLLFKPAHPASGALLYATMFQNPNDTDWYQYQGTSSVQITNGSLNVNVDELSNSIFSPLNYLFNDFDARVVVRQLNGDDPYSEYGILFRYQDSKNYYMFKIRGDVAYHVERTLNGQTIDLSAPHTAPSFAPGANHVNDLHVVANGNQFRFYLNDQPLILCPKGSDKFSTWNGERCLSNGGQTSDTLIDTTFSDGEIGLGLYENESAVQVAFTNLTIYSPQS